MVEVDVKGCDERTLNMLFESLDQTGFKYDEDYEALYGAYWATTGIRCYNLRTVEHVLLILSIIERFNALLDLVKELEEEEMEDGRHTLGEVST